MIERLGVTSIFVTHDQSEAIEVADEIIITNKGRIEQIGSPIDIYQHPQTAFSASFFGQTTTLDDYTKFKTFDVVDNVDRAVIRPEFVKVTKLSETTAQKASVSVGEVIKTSFRGDNIEIAVKCDGGTVYAYRGLDETPITVGEKAMRFRFSVTNHFRKNRLSSNLFNHDINCKKSYKNKQSTEGNFSRCFALLKIIFT